MEVVVAFPEDVLSDDERVVMHLHPHWKALIWPGVVTVVAIGGTIAAALLNQVALIVVGALAVIGFIWLAVWPYLKWRTTHYVFTNERVLLQTGEPHQRPLDEPELHRADARLRHADHRVGR